MRTSSTTYRVPWPRSEPLAAMVDYGRGDCGGGSLIKLLIGRNVQGRMNIDSFVAPASVTARKIRDGERRVLLNNVALIATVVAGAVVSYIHEMPANISQLVLPLLVLILDQGSTGSSGVYFAMGHKQLMVSARWDSFHRGVNDLKLSCQHALGGLFRRVILLSTYVFNINYGPFGKGAFFDEKKVGAPWHLLVLCVNLNSNPKHVR